MYRFQLERSQLFGRSQRLRFTAVLRRLEMKKQSASSATYLFVLVEIGLHSVAPADFGRSRDTPAKDPLPSGRSNDLKPTYDSFSATLPAPVCAWPRV